MLTKLNIEMLISLKEKIEAWLEEDSLYQPHLGENTATLMAQAALSVLLAIEDAQDSLTEDGLLKQEE